MKKFTRSILDWYEKGHRAFPWRETQDPYRIWISEIMLQQTRAETVVSYYNRFLERFPDVLSLAEAEEDSLMKAWEGLGYYSRARNLKKCAGQIVSAYGGHFPESAEELETLPGIGPYTAGAIASIAFDRRSAAVDGNVLRVMARVHCIEEDIKKQTTVLEITREVEKLLPDTGCGTFTNAMMELGACICTPKHPDCASCPVEAFCKAKKEGRVDALPVRGREKEKKVEQRDVLLLFRGKQVLVEKTETGLLRGLYTFPHGLACHIPQMLERLGSQGIQAEYGQCAAQARHVFSHVIWEMNIHELTVRKAPHGAFFVDATQLAELPMATAMKKARQICLARMNDANGISM